MKSLRNLMLSIIVLSTCTAFAKSDPGDGPTEGSNIGNAIQRAVISCSQNGSTRSFVLFKGATGFDAVMINPDGRIVDSLTGLDCKLSMSDRELLRCSWPDSDLIYRLDKGEAGLDFFGSVNEVVSQKFNYTGLAKCRLNSNLP